MKCKDWTQSLRKASYKGASFEVETDGESGGRRIKIHEFACSEQHTVEDLGKVAGKFDVTAYVTGDDVDAKKSAVFAACTSKGPGTLVLPMETGRIQANCQSVKTSRSKDKHGYIAITLSFVRSGNGTPVLGVVRLPRAVEIAAGAIGTVLSAAFSQAFNVDGSADTVRESAISVVEDVAAIIAEAAAYTPTEGDAISTLTKQAQQLYNEAPALVFEPAALIARQGDLMAQFFKATRAGNGARGFKELAEFGVSYPAIAPTTGTRVQQKRIRDVMTYAIRVQGLAYYAAELTQIDYATRSDAITSRADLAAVFEQHDYMELPFFDQTLSYDLAKIRGLAIKAISVEVANQAPILDIVAPQSMPSLYWVYRLYGSLDKEEELVTRNAIALPLFMPRDFEAVAS